MIKITCILISILCGLCIIRIVCKAMKEARMRKWEKEADEFICELLGVKNDE